MTIESATKAKELESRLQAMETELKEKQQEILAMESRMQSFRNAGNIREYNALVTSHNSQVSDYNDSLKDYHQLIAKYEKYVLVHNYIINHEYDRKGVYEYTKTNIPA